MQFSAAGNYLKSGCSTHMKGRMCWFVKINRAMKNKVKLADDTTQATDGISVVLIMIRDGELLSIGQLLEKGYKIHMKNNGLRVMDANRVLILKAPMTADRTLKVELNVIEYGFLAITVSQE